MKSLLQYVQQRSDMKMGGRKHTPVCPVKNTCINFWWNNIEKDAAALMNIAAILILGIVAACIIYKAVHYKLMCEGPIISGTNWHALSLFTYKCNGFCQSIGKQQTDDISIL